MTPHSRQKAFFQSISEIFEAIPRRFCTKSRSALIGRTFFCCLKEKFGIVHVRFGHHGDDETGKKADRSGDDSKERSISGLETGENRQSQGCQQARTHAPNGGRTVKPLPVEAQKVTGQQCSTDSAPRESHEGKDRRFHRRQQIGANNE